MNHIFPEKHKCIYILLFVYAITFLLITGCERRPKLTDIHMDLLEKWSRKSWPPDAKERITSAINKYKNKMVDPIPILIRAVVGKIGPEEYKLYLAIFDEDEDLLGFVIREETEDPNGIVTTLEEDYPIFAHDPGVCVANVYGGFEIFARKDEERKDEKAWEDYLKMDFDAKVSQLELPSSSKNWYENEVEKYDRIFQLLESLQPAIFISMPNSDKLKVWIYVYDKAGNKSNTIELNRREN
jgi:hypothetical protein